MSGGVDSAVAAHLCAQTGDDPGGDARAVGRRRERRRAQLLLGHGGRPGALAGPPDGHPALHHRPARGVPRRGRGPVHRRLRGGGDAQPVRGLQRPCPAGRDARAGRPPRLRDAGHGPLRAHRRVTTTPRGPLLRAAADAAKDQTYMLAALQARVAGADALPAGRAAQARGARDRGAAPACRWRPRSTPRTCASWPGRAAPGSWSATAASTAAPARSSTAAARSLGRHDGQHRFTVGQRRGIEHPRRRAAVRARTRTPPAAGSPSAPAEELRTDRVAIRAARLHRDGSRVNSVKLRYRQRPLSASVAGDPGEGRHRSLSLRARRAGRRRGARAAGLPDGRRPGGGVGDDRRRAAGVAPKLCRL